MNTPNKAAPPVDLGQHVNMGCNAPFWLQCAHGFNRYEAGRLLCPVCGSARVRPDPTSKTSIFTPNRHHQVDFEKNTVEEAFDTNNGLNIISFMIDLVCDQGHAFEFDLHFTVDRPEEGTTLEVLLSDGDYQALFPAEYQKWGDQERGI